ncbi:MAG: phage tail protein, partial [Rubrivivax sp.]|nr:phage tail protein [Rubrivivax sp.]
MKIDAPPRFALMLGTAAWQRCAFEDATLVAGIVQLGWDTHSEGGAPQPVSDRGGAGLAFDAHCRLFHSLPAARRVERLLWAAADPSQAPPPMDWLGDVAAAPGGEFSPVGAPPTSFTPRALACDAQDHLYVLDTQANQLRIVDLQQRRVQRSQPLPAGAVDIAWFDGWLYGLSFPPAPQPPTLWRLAAQRALQTVAAPVAALPQPARLAFARDGRLFVLQRAHEADAGVAEMGRPGAWLAAPRPLAFGGGANPFAFASDIVCVDDGVCCGGVGSEHLVVARRGEEDFVRVDLASRPYALAEPLGARHYDGLGIEATADGRIVFWTAKGARHATAARLRYRSPGRVTGWRLDSGSHQTVWGRVLVDACIPAQTSVRVHCIVGDDEDEAARVPRTPPMFASLAPIDSPQTTPLPLLAHQPDPAAAGQLLFRRSDGSEQPWLVEHERFDTYETPAPATPGRYLWLVFDIGGHSRATPRLRGVRAECPGHDWLRRLPQLYSRDEAMRSLLQRFLAPPAGLVDDLARQSDQRQALLKPRSAAAAALPWLANWIGLVLDERWSDAARRQFIAEAAWLFRLRGTV